MNTLLRITLASLAIVATIGFASATPSVIWPPARCLELGGGSQLITTTCDLGSGLVFSLSGGIGTLTCSIVSTTGTCYKATCNTPSHSAISNLVLTLSAPAIPWSQNSPNYYSYSGPNPYISSIVSPEMSGGQAKLPLVGGTLLTLSGKCFGSSSTIYDYTYIGALWLINSASSSWISTSDNAIVVKTPSGGNTATNNMDITLTWNAEDNWQTVTSAASYVAPVINSYWVEPYDTFYCRLHLTGSYLGPNANPSSFYSSVNLGTGGTKTSVKIENNEAIVDVSGITISNQNVCLKWGSNVYSSCKSGVSFSC